ncbi:MAG: TIR domain-containing protein, partial [Clostridia bacterium]|nr:TIR domain-containing protein [Clostridia bacterium]
MVINKKYDIFISYRHNNMTLVGELVHRLERYYDVFWDQRLESGYWSEQLTRAIDNSRAVLINLTLNSLNKNQNGEDWFYKEIVYSMEHKAKEEIIPVCYDGFVFPENLAFEGITDKEKEKLSILRDDHQRITDLKTLDEIIVKIISYLSAIGVEPKEEFSASKKEYSLKFESLSPVQSFIGREAEISETIKLVNENDMVFLYGMGGIGKTELAKKIMEEMTGEYRCIFCKYESSLKNTLSKIEITGIDTEDFNIKERILHKLLNKNVILVIDNFDFSADKDIDNYIHELCKYSCKKLITTRNSFREIEFPCKTDFIPLGSLSFSDLKALFEKKYGKEITEGQFEKILSFTGGLTLAVPILASLCLKSEITIDELCEKLASGIRGLENTESVRYMKDGNKKGNVPEILRILFDMDKISESKKNTLRNLSILQFMPVTKRLYKEIACSDGKGNLDDFNELAEDGWIKEVFVSENGVSYYELHPLINALVK